MISVFSRSLRCRHVMSLAALLCFFTCGVAGAQEIPNDENGASPSPVVSPSPAVPASPAVPVDEVPEPAPLDAPKPLRENEPKEVKDGSAGPPDPKPPTADQSELPDPIDAANFAVRPPGPSRLLWIPRVIAFIPRWLFYGLNTPVRGGLYAYDRFDVVDRVEGLFFDEERIYGLYPTALFETGFGANIGARFVHKDLFQSGVGVKLRAGFGGQFQQVYGATLNFDNALPEDWTAGIRTSYERRPKDRFFGYGNNDISTGMITGADPFATRVATRYRQNIFETFGVASYHHPQSRFSFTTTAGHSIRSFSGEGEFGEEQSLSTVYDSSLVPGFDNDMHQLTVGVDVKYDSRRGYTQWDPDTIPSRGFLLSTFADSNLGVGRNNHAFIRYGGEVQSFLRVAQGPRILAARFRTESTSAVRGSIPFVNIPRLGGGRYLRGYRQDQFRDSTAMLGTVEYSFDAGRWLRVAFFADAGRTFRKLEDLSFEDLRVGYGTELRIVTGERVSGRVSLSSSIDGGFFTLISFDSAFDDGQRYGRK